MSTYRISNRIFHCDRARIMESPNEQIILFPEQQLQYAVCIVEVRMIYARGVVVLRTFIQRAFVHVLRKDFGDKEMFSLR